MAPTNFPPGPADSQLRQTLRWFYRPLNFIEESRREFGEIFSVSFLGFKTPMVLFSDPAGVKAVYTNRANGLPPGRNTVLEPIVGARSLLLLEGSEHLARRRLMLPPFHGERMRSYEEVVRTTINREIDTWPVGEPFSIHPHMQSVTLDVILRAVFGVNEGESFLRLRDLLGRVLHRTSSPSMQLGAFLTRRFEHFGPSAAMKRELETTDRELFEVIAEHREDPNLAERDDILSALLLAEFEDGTHMDDRELRDQLMTLLLAGHETTATGLAWAFDMILRTPAAQERLVDEIRSGAGDDYVRATVTEALRLRPVVPIAGRRLAADTVVDGFELEAGTDVAPTMWMTHTRPDLYPDPFDFRPERFLENGPDTYGWIPFGGGVRRCIGASFAEFEMRIVIEEVLRRCDMITGADRAESIGRRNVTFSPKDGTRVIVTERRPARELALA